MVNRQIQRRLLEAIVEPSGKIMSSLQSLCVIFMLLPIGLWRTLAFRRCLKAETMDFEKIGRTRLMVRLPRHRQQLAKLRLLSLSTLLEACGIAVITRVNSKDTRSQANL